MVITRFFKIAGCMILREIFCMDKFGWLFFLGTIIIFKFIFVDSKSWVSVIDWASKWCSRLLSDNNNSKNWV